jgi:Gly-Xaa carboxypeptidase
LRLAFDIRSSSVSAVQSYDTERLKGLASSYNLTFDAFGNITDPDAPSSGILTLSDAFHTGLEPAPLTPVNATPYHLLSGTIKTTYNTHRSIKGRDNIYVAPGMMAGNTGAYSLWTIIVVVFDCSRLDTRYYWNLSQHIFRYNHQNAGNASDDVFNHIHTVDECRLRFSFLLHPYADSAQQQFPLTRSWR